MKTILSEFDFEFAKCSGVVLLKIAPAVGVFGSAEQQLLELAAAAISSVGAGSRNRCLAQADLTCVRPRE